MYTKSVILLSLLVITFFGSFGKGFDLSLDSLTDSTHGFLSRLERSIDNDFIEFNEIDDLTNFRNRIRKKLSSYANQVKLVHGLPTESESPTSRHKRSTIVADKLTSAVSRKRRNYAAQSYDLSMVDAGTTHVVKRVYQLQRPSFGTLNVTDLNVITYNGILYLIAIEQSSSTKTHTVFYKLLQNWEVEQVGRLSTPNAQIVEVMEIENYYYILPASYSPSDHYSLEGGSPLYRIDFRNNGQFNAVKIQAINTEFARSIIFWRSSAVEANDVILCVSPEKTMTSQGYRYKVYISCYRWQGGYFDLTYSLPAYNPQAVSYMSISSHNYICVANYQDDSGSTSIFSTVFRYSHKTGDYLPFQKIQTYGAKDCKHFRFDSPEQVKEHYLAIANFGQVDEYGKVDYSVKSYIYKFGVGRFILFQSIVTIGAFQILPIQDGSKFLLIIGELNRLSIYQHNGWNFVKTSEIDFPHENLVNQFRMRPMLANNGTYFTLAGSKLTAETGIYGLEYEEKNDYVTMNKELEEWCVKAVQTVQYTNLTQLVQAASRVPNTTEPEIIIKSSLTFTSSLHADSVFTQSLQHNGVHFDAERSKSLARKEARLEELETRVNIMAEKIDNAISLNGNQIVETKIDFAEWIVSNESSLTAVNLKTDQLNQINLVELLKNLVFLDQNYEFKNVAIDILLAREEIQAQQLNGKAINDFVLKSSGNIQQFLDDNIFLKNISALQGFDVSSGYINGVRTENILTTRSDQTFSEININSSVVRNLVARYINGVDLERFIGMSVPNSGDHTILGDKQFSQLNSGEIWAENYLSGFKPLQLYTEAVYLSNITKDTFTGFPIFESVEITSLETSNQLINNLYNLSSGFVSKTQKTIFAESVKIYNNASIRTLDVKRNLNDISVVNDELNVLLKNSSTTQYLHGQEVHGIRLEKPSTLQGYMNGIDIQTWNPVKIIPLENPNISGDVFAWNVSFSHELTSTQLQQGFPQPQDVLTILQKSIPLTTQQLQCDPKSLLIFDSIHVLNNSQIDFINHISPNQDLVIKGPPHQEITVKGSKYFFGNITLLNHSTSTHGLDIPVDSSYQNFIEIFSQLQTLMLNGTDQVVTGNFLFNGLKVINLKSDNQITLDGIPFNDILLTEDPDQVVQIQQNIFQGGLTVKNSLVVIQDLNSPFINGFNLETSLLDTLKTRSPHIQVIHGTVQFGNGLYLHDVSMTGQLESYDIEELFSSIVLNSGQSTEVNIRGSIVFKGQANLSSLDYLGSMNGISPAQWGQNWMSRYGNQEISTPLQFLNPLTVDKISVVDHKVNDIDVNQLNEEILRKDQDGSLGLASFSSPLIIVNGDICSKSFNGFNVSKDFLRKRFDSLQIVTATKLFKGHWSILENLNVEILEDIDFVNLVRFVNTIGNLTEEKENLEVFGNCHSYIEPGLVFGGHVNGHDWDQVLRESWFTNQDTTVLTPIILDPLFFMYLNEGGQVDGLIDGVNVSKLNEEYLSLSGDQEWGGNFQFQSKVCVNKSLDVEETQIWNGTLNGLDILRFSWSALLDGVEQNVTSRLITKQLNSPHVSLSGTVNGVDFCRDIVVVDGENLSPISGLKHVENIFVDNLQLPPGAIVNGVSLDLWRQLMVTTNGNYILQGDRHFETAEFSDVTVNGLADGKSINDETVMTLSGNQSGIGVIIIAQNVTSPSTNFGHIYTRGTVNEEDLDEYFENLVLVNETKPLYIHGKKEILGKVHTSWLKTEGPYEQHGINLIEFLSNYATPSQIGQKYNVALREQYEKISHLTTDLIHVATDRAVLTESFESISKISRVGAQIVDLRVTHALERPMVTVILRKYDMEVALWFTYNMTTNAYQLNEIEQYTVVGRVVDFSEHTNKGHYYIFVALSSFNNTEVTSTIPTVPSNTDFLLNNETNKLSKGGVLRLVEETVNGKPRIGFVISQLLFGDEFGNVLSFYFVTESGSTRDCILYSVLDKNNFHALVFCFHPEDFQGIDDYAVHFFQKIPLTIAPQLTSMVIGTKTLVIISGSGSSTFESDKNGHGGVINVWTHEKGDGPLIQEDCFPVVNILSIDSMLAPNNNPFLAVVSARLPNTNHLGLVFVYKYSMSRKKFVKYQTIQEDDPIDVQFQRLIPSNETFLYILTGSRLHNVNVYSFKGLSGWNKEFSITSEGGLSIKSSAFYYQDNYKAQALVVNSTNVDVVNVNFNGVPYIPPKLHQKST